MISPYIQSIKDWKIRAMVSGFLKAKAIFEKNNKRTDTDILISFKILRRLCDILFYLKEDHHAIYKRIVNPKDRTFEDANKFTPNDVEINFMNNIGLLFHKMMVARELKYMLDYYTEDSTGYQETKNSIVRNLQIIGLLFKQGAEILKSMLSNHADNILLLIYFLENQKMCTSQFNMDLESILKLVTGDKGLDHAYMTAAHYYLSSGWFEKTKNMCLQVVELNPNNKDAHLLLNRLEL